MGSPGGTAAREKHRGRCDGLQDGAHGIRITEEPRELQSTRRPLRRIGQNSHRLHSYLGYMSPNDYERQLMAQRKAA